MSDNQRIRVVEQHLLCYSSYLLNELSPLQHKDRESWMNHTLEQLLAMRQLYLGKLGGEMNYRAPREDLNIPYPMFEYDSVRNIYIYYINMSIYIKLSKPRITLYSRRDCERARAQSIRDQSPRIVSSERVLFIHDEVAMDDH